MARFYLHLLEDGGRIEDEEGLELPDLKTARLVAIRNARSIIADDVKTRGIIPLTFVIQITDENGSIAAALTFREAVTLR